jgi:quinol monooxygenase YgiN
MIAPSLAEPGCLSYQIYLDLGDPRSLVVVEEWTDLEAFDEHLASTHVAHAQRLTSTLLAEPPSIRILKAV